jgi:hypothetical protein
MKLSDEFDIVEQITVVGSQHKCSYRNIADHSNLAQFENQGL